MGTTPPASPPHLPPAYPPEEPYGPGARAPYEPQVQEPRGPEVRDGTGRAAPDEPTRKYPTGAAALGRLPREEVRALWVVRTALLHPDSARAAVRRAHLAGFNTLLVQVRGRGDAYYRSSWEPRAEPLSGQPSDYDPLAVVLEEARGLGLQVHAWVNAHVVASALLPPTDPLHLALSRPELLAVPRELAPRLLALDPRDPAYLHALLQWTRNQGERVEGLYTSPAHPAVRDHLLAVVLDLAKRYPLDGIHLDYLRYPSPDFDFSRRSLEEFRDWLEEMNPDAWAPIYEVGSTVPGTEGPGQLRLLPDRFPAQWSDFQRDRLTAFLALLRGELLERRPHLLLSAAVFADAGDARAARFQPWEEWLQAGLLDVVAPMAYTTSEAIWESQILRAAAAGHPRRVWAGLGVYRDSFESAVRKGRRAAELHTGGLVLFSYDWAVGPEGASAARGSYLDRFSRELWGGGAAGGR